MSDEQEITIGELHRVCARIEQKVDRINGNVGQHDTRIAVLEDRGNRDTTARATGIGGAIAAAGSFLYQWFSK
jgi:hypothetical protein